jgi:hypothetical protein
MILLIFSIIINISCKRTSNAILENNINNSILIDNISSREEIISKENSDFFDITIFEDNFEQFILSSDNPIINFATREFLEMTIMEPDKINGIIIYDELKSDELTIYFGAPDETKPDALRKYGGGRLLYDSDGNFWFSSDTLFQLLEFKNYNIILVTQEINNIVYVRDFLFLEKYHSETHFVNSAGAAMINGGIFGTIHQHQNLIIVVNRHWRGRYTEDISHVFFINMQSRKIEQIEFETIRLTSEL